MIPDANVPMMQIHEYHLLRCSKIREHNLRSIQERGFTLAFNNLHYLLENMATEYHQRINEVLENLAIGDYSACGGNPQEMIEDAKKINHEEFTKDVEQGKYSHNFVLSRNETYRYKRSQYVKINHL